MSSVEAIRPIPQLPDLPQGYLERFPTEPIPVTLEDYTSENLKYAMNADALSLIVMMTLAYWKIKDPDHVPTASELHQTITLMQVEPLDNVLQKVKPRKPLPLPDDSEYYWLIDRRTIGDIRQELERGILEDDYDPYEVLSIGGKILNFWKNKDFPITPRVLISSKDGSFNRFRTLKYLDQTEIAEDSQLREITEGDSDSRNHHISTLESVGIVDYYRRSGIMYQLVAKISPEILEQVYQTFPSRQIIEKAYDVLSKLKPEVFYGIRYLVRQAEISEGNFDRFISALRHLAYDPNSSAYVKRIDPGVKFADRYSAVLHDFIQVVDGSIDPYQQFISDGYTVGQYHINDPEFIREFLLRSRNELDGYEARKETSARRRVELVPAVKEFNFQEILTSDLDASEKTNIIINYILQGGFISADGRKVGSWEERDRLFPDNTIAKAFDRSGIVSFNRDGEQMLAVRDLKTLLARQTTPQDYESQIVLQAFHALKRRIERGDAIEFVSPKNEYNIHEVLASDLSAKEKTRIIISHMLSGGFISRDGMVLGTPKERSRRFPDDTLDRHFRAYDILSFEIDGKQMITIKDPTILSQLSNLNRGELGLFALRDAIEALERRIERRQRLIVLDGYIEEISS